MAAIRPVLAVTVLALVASPARLEAQESHPGGTRIATSVLTSIAGSLVGAVAGAHATASVTGSSPAIYAGAALLAGVGSAIGIAAVRPASVGDGWVEAQLYGIAAGAVGAAILRQAWGDVDRDVALWIGFSFTHGTLAALLAPR